MKTAATTYAIRVEGHLDDHWSPWLSGLDIARGDDGATTITVEVADQAQLHGVLAGLRDIGAVISELRSSTASRRPVLERPLRTERLTLRPATLDDAGPAWNLRRLGSVDEWRTGWPADRALFSTPDHLASTVIVTLGHAGGAPVIGDFTLHREDARAELGWVFDPTYGGHGYATEAARELLRHCFGDLGLRRVIAHCFLADDASWRLMERIGMRREQHAVRESLHRSGRWLDTVGYAILKDEWPPA